MTRTLALALVALAVARAADAAALDPGAYRLELHLASRAAMPLVGATRSESVSVALAEIRADGDRLVQRHRVCDVRIEGGIDVVRLEMPARFVQALAEHVYPVDWVPADGGGRYRADLGEEHVGYDPDRTAALPATADAPGVMDTDGDGAPGATLRLVLPIVPDGELWVVQRGHSRLDGRLVAPGRVEGRIDVEAFEQRVIGARPSFLQRTPEIVPESERSRFVLRAVPAGTTCTDLVRGAGAAP